MYRSPRIWSFRQCCLAGFVLCAAVIGFALFSQFQWGLNPCPLCIFQRLAFAASGMVLLVAGVHAPGGRLGRGVYAALAFLPTSVGLGIATRHVWLTHLPADQVPACGPPLDFMIDALPLQNVIRQVLSGSGECAKVDWSLLGLSMPTWSLLTFVMLALLIARLPWLRSTASS